MSQKLDRAPHLDPSADNVENQIEVLGMTGVELMGDISIGILRPKQGLQCDGGGFRHDEREC